jgi:hypothetical protein
MKTTTLAENMRAAWVNRAEQAIYTLLSATKARRLFTLAATDKASDDYQRANAEISRWSR